MTHGVGRLGLQRFLGSSGIRRAAGRTALAGDGAEDSRSPRSGRILTTLRYLGGRLLRLLLSMFAVSVITFALLQLVPGSFQQLSGDNVGSGLGATATVTNGEAATHAGSAHSAVWQYLTFMKGVVTWDMGPSYKFPQLTVQDVITQAFPVSLTLAVLATVLTLAIAIPIGLLSAVKKDTSADYGPMFVLTTAAALPGYLAALVLILLLSTWLGLLPTGGWDGARTMVIPVLALAVHPIATLARYVRSSVLENLREEYVVAAYAKGGSKPTVLTRHVLRNSLIPLVTVVGPMFAHLATGTVFIEALMGIPGLGLYFTVAARSRDMPLLMGTTLLFAFLLMVMNLLVDLSYRVLDPRIRYQVRTRRRGRRLASVPGGDGDE